jgi:hypothetical protein
MHIHSRPVFVEKAMAFPFGHSWEARLCLYA